MPAEFIGSSLPLGSDGFMKVVDTLEVPAAEVWAILEVETSGSGYLPDGRPRILFERHIFRRQTGGRFDAVAPDLSQPTAGGYGRTGAPQYDRLERAAQLDRRAALNSASWGLGQIMGFNAQNAGFADVEAMVAAMIDSENAQLDGLAGFIISQDLHLPLRARSWADFARGYNGPQYAMHQYDARLDAAYRKFAQGPLPDLTVRAAQTYLTFLGFSPGSIDGVAGRLTLSALREWQEASGFPQQDVVDDEAIAALAEAVAKQRAGAGG
jgi:hypothetical protein